MAPGDQGDEEVTSIIHDYHVSATHAHSIREATESTPPPRKVNFSANIDAKIRNPLVGIPRRRLLADIDDFCRAKGLEKHRGIIRKGALVAQDPSGYEDITGPDALSPDEVEALRDEILHKWRVPRALKRTILVCSIGAAVQGWDQTGSNGATLEFPKALGIGGSSMHDKLIVGLINAGPYIGTALVGCWMSDPINNLLGRRGTVFVASQFCLWPVIASAFCNDWQSLLGCRLLLGVGMGSKAATVPIYAAEATPAPIRGALVMSWQLWVSFGIFLGTLANLVCAKAFVEPWRYQLGCAFLPAVPLALLIYSCPESPRWYIKKNRYVDAMNSLLRLRNNPVQAGRDLYYIHVQLQVEHEYIGRGNYLRRIVELFTIPRIRRATLASWVVMIAQQMCGINIIAFYSTSVFAQAGSTDFEAYLSTMGFGLINFVFAFPAIWTIDTFGRRSLLLFTFPQMAWTLLAAGLCTLIPPSTGLHTVFVAFFVYLFAAFYSPGEGPVPYPYSAEVFPLSHREVGMAWAVATCLFWAAILSITFPLMLDRLGVLNSFVLYGCFNLIALVMIFLWLPETKQRTLEELDYIFAVPTRVFMRYQVTKTLPWWFKRWILFRKNVPLEPLYHLDFENHREEDDEEEGGSGSRTYETDKSRIEMKDALGLGFTTARTVGI
ncbi:Arabinose-proton symporter-like protein [Emericellopsis cladophorae]|uniref:Arabinose-proton symporter-like protein n=1 Tax=Emericellopsis cladophorae TaxID=2686198 RepID=A0A9Q0BF75_9HYPO|nr:Arabinose-proton symporter-like protein [Emericellopsis cladophorae]KAI6782601.1 Arabinose-proton symporter-like protein [Emericellopsis cladophorae]